MLVTYRFEFGQDLAQTLERYVLLYNQHFLQQRLQHQTPIQAMKLWRENKPGLFKKAECNYTELKD